MSEPKLDDLTLDEAIDARSALIALRNSDGWALLCKIWRTDLEMQSNAFGGPIKSEFELYAQEWTKGAVAQIKADLELPTKLIDTLNDQIQTHPENKENRNVSSPSTDDPSRSGSPDFDDEPGGGDSVP